MDNLQLLPLLKYFHGEEQNPFTLEDKNAAMWWDGEKYLYDTVAANPNYWSNLTGLFDKCINKGQLSGFLVDKSIPMEKRIICFFLDLWHGKWFPYDNLDAIQQY